MAQMDRCLLVLHPLIQCDDPPFVLAFCCRFDFHPVQPSEIDDVSVVFFDDLVRNYERAR